MSDEDFERFVREPVESASDESDEVLLERLRDSIGLADEVDGERHAPSGYFARIGRFVIVERTPRDEEPLAYREFRDEDEATRDFAKLAELFDRWSFGAPGDE